MSNPPETGHGWWGRVAGYGAAWTGIGLIAGFQIYLGYRYAGLHIGPLRSIGLGLFQWYTWAALFPVLYGLCRRFPIRRGAWSRCLIHLPVSVVVAVSKEAIERAFIEISRIVPDRPAELGTLNTTILTAWILIGIGHALVFAKESRERAQRALRLETQLSRARLELLRRQLQPHFLFNTLHAITALMRRDLDAAERMLVRLGDLLRLSLDHADDPVVPLESELAFTRLYLQIQQIRFGEHLRVDWSIAAACLDLRVPTMILQPLVENAVEHGLKREAGGDVEIMAARQDGKLVLRVTDGGRGLADAPQASGVGLANTRSRLQTLYGEHASLSIDPRPRGGTRVTLTLPSDPAGPGSGKR